MYSWIWRHLPGPFALRAVLASALVVAVVALLWLVVFPWLELLLPFSEVDVG